MPGENTVKLFAEYGGFIGLLVGVMIVGLGVAIVFMWRHIVSLNKQLQDVQNKRVAEAIEVRKELIGLAEDFDQGIRELSTTFIALKDAMLLRGDR